MAAMEHHKRSKAAEKRYRRLSAVFGNDFAIDDANDAAAGGVTPGARGAGAERARRARVAEGNLSC